MDLDKEYIRTGDKAKVQFRFLYWPEFVKVGSRLIFREGRTKGIGRILRIIPEEEEKGDVVMPNKKARKKMAEEAALSNNNNNNGEGENKKEGEGSEEDGGKKKNDTEKVEENKGR